MIPDNRRNEILSLLKQEGYLSVEQLAKSSYVSLPTMRRDLAQLEKEGLIKRIHGGASYFNGEMPMLPFNLRNKEMLNEKMRIGKAAAKLLNDNDFVFFDSCSTCLCLAKSIDAKLRLNVLTNSIVIAQTLSENESINVEIVGGSYDPKNLSIYSQEAIEYINNRHAKYCFVTANSLDKTFGLSNVSSIDIPIKKAFARNADKVVLLIDSSRINRKNFYKVFELNEIDILITDKRLDDELMNVCLKNNVEVIIA